MEAAAYDQEDGRRVIYAVNTGWYSQEETARGVLCAGGVEYPGASQNKSVAKYIMDLRLEMIARELRETSRSFSEIIGTAEELRVCLDGVSRVTLPDRFG